jgi:hypothetical protein
LVWCSAYFPEKTIARAMTATARIGRRRFTGAFL